jgi:hypothetical protein
VGINLQIREIYIRSFQITYRRNLTPAPPRPA